MGDIRCRHEYGVHIGRLAQVFRRRERMWDVELCRRSLRARQVTLRERRDSGRAGLSERRHQALTCMQAEPDDAEANHMRATRGEVAESIQRCLPYNIQ